MQRGWRKKQNNRKNKNQGQSLVLSRIPLEKHPFGVWIWSAVIMELFLEILSRRSVVRALLFPVKSPVLFLINTGIILAVYSLMFLTRRSWFVHGLVTTVLLLIGITDWVLLCFRTTPLTAQDVHQIGSAMRVLKHYISWFAVIPAVLLLAGIVVFLVYLWRKAPVWQGMFPRGKNLLKAAVSIAAAAAAFAGIVKTELVPARFSNIGKAYQDYGIVYCLVSSMIHTGIDRPDDYCEEEVDGILEEKTEPERCPETDEAKQTPNVIFLQLESFYDVTKLKNLRLSEDPLPFLHGLEQAYSTGKLSVPCVGAGTANTEFEIMTGMNLDFFGPGEYPYQTVLRDRTCESLAYLFHRMGYVSQAIHNNSAGFYDRQHVFSQLGYDRFTSIEYMSGLEYTPTGWAKDAVLTSGIMDALKSTEKPDYIYAISVQGHGAYPEKAVDEESEIRVQASDEDGEYSETLTNQFTYYVSQISQMDRFLQALVGELTAWDEPCVLVLYGDHLPSLGIQEEDLTEGTIFQTDYVIWDNLGLARQEKDVEAYQLGALVMNQIGVSDGILFRYHQKWLNGSPQDADTQSSADEAEYLDKMKTISYDMLYGEQEVYDGNCPWQPTSLQMGTHRPLVSWVCYEPDRETMTVHGRNFNAFSAVLINGKEYEPSAWTENELIVENVPDGTRFTVSAAQVDDYNKTILSATPGLQAVKEK